VGKFDSFCVLGLSEQFCTDRAVDRCRLRNEGGDASRDFMRIRLSRPGVAPPPGMATREAITSEEHTDDLKKARAQLIERLRGCARS
jgi:hypothetical protein